MSEKILKGRSVQKHDTEANWLKATNFIPKQGEIIIYDKDANYDYERMKIGDGTTIVSSLPFVEAGKAEIADHATSADSATKATQDASGNIITDTYATKTELENVSELVGDTSVATQISTAVVNKVDKVNGKGLSTNDYTTEEKNKLAGIEEGANNTIVDYEPNSMSDNPIANMAACNLSHLAVQVSDILDGTELRYNGQEYFTSDEFTYRTRVSDLIPTIDDIKNGFSIVTGETPNFESSEEDRNPSIKMEGFKFSKAYDFADYATDSSIYNTYVELYEGADDEYYNTSDIIVLSVPGDDVDTYQACIYIVSGTTSTPHPHDENIIFPSGGIYFESGTLALRINGYSFGTIDAITPSSIGAMAASNPVGTGDFSINRKAGTKVGYYSSTLGNNNTASGSISHAEGSLTIASGGYSHAEGNSTEARGMASHAEGNLTIASGKYQHVQGKYNIADATDTYAHIVGNGTSNTARSNAHTLDWDGNAWFAGNVTVGEDNKILATQEYSDTVAAGKADKSEITALSTLIGDTAVATQISNAIANYYTKTEIDSYELITVADIDAICGGTTEGILGQDDIDELMAQIQ